LASVVFGIKARKEAREAEKQTADSIFNYNEAQKAKNKLADALQKEKKANNSLTESNTSLGKVKRLYQADKLADSANDALADDDPTKAILLSLQGALLLRAHRQRVPIDIQAALYQAAETNRERLVLPSSTGKIAYLAFSPDGRRLATAYNNNREID